MQEEIFAASFQIMVSGIRLRQFQYLKLNFLGAYDIICKATSQKLIAVERGGVSMPVGMLVAIIAHTFFLIMALLLGYVFYTGKAGFLPGGIRWKESQVDAKKLMRFTGILMFFIAFCVVLMIISDLTEIEILHTIALILMGIILMVFLIRGNGTHFLKYK